jgi:AraC-like DNA-binding protein
MTERTVAAGVALGLMHFAVSKGASQPELVVRSGIKPSNLRAADDRVPFSSYVALMKAGQELCNDPALALHFAAEVDLSGMSVLGLLTHASETMLGAFNQLNRYHRLVSESEQTGVHERFQHWSADRRNLWLVDTLECPKDFPESVEQSLGRLVCGPRRFHPAPFAKEIHFIHAPPPYYLEYERVLRSPVVFNSDKNALLIAKTWPSQPIAPGRRYTFGLLSAQADAMLKRLERGKTVRSCAERLLMNVLHTGQVRMEAIALAMGVSRPTLHRQLKAEGTTYEVLRDELRHRMTLYYLKGKKVSVNETAYLVGFSDPATFFRAFKRWTGTTPRRRMPK